MWPTRELPCLWPTRGMPVGSSLYAKGEFVVGAFDAEMGLQAPDVELMAAHNGDRIVTRSGLVLDGGLDQVEAPPTGPAEIDTAVVDYLEYYLFSYFKPAHGEEDHDTLAGRRTFERAGCTSCHVPTLTVVRDRRVADVETVHEFEHGGAFNALFATASGLFTSADDGSGASGTSRRRWDDRSSCAIS